MSSRKNLKVMFITEDFYPQFIGGQGIYGYKLIFNLAKLGCKISILAENKKGRREFWQNTKNTHLTLVPFCFGNQLLLAFFQYIFFIQRYRDTYFDILHANQLSGLFFVLFKPKNIKKIVVSVHNTYFDMYKYSSPFKKLLYQLLIPLEKFIYHKADALLFNTQSEKESLLSYYQISQKETEVVPLGVDPVSFSKSDRLSARKTIREVLNFNPNNKIILYVGRLVKRKRVDLLIKSCNRLKSVKVIIIGKGKDRENLEKIASENIKFLGYVDNTKPYFLASDCFANLSVAEGGVVLSALEAASFGLPLVLSSDSSDESILKNGVNGFVVTSEKELIPALSKTLETSEKMGKESLKLAKFLTWEKCAQNTLKFYQQIQKL